MMNLTALASRAVETTPLPDALTRMGIRYLVARARRRLASGHANAEAAFAAAMRSRPIAENTGEANAQHYEIPARFFQLILGPRLKYSSCLYAASHTTLIEAENAALRETCSHADIRDGQDILELGCGWGSLTLWMAERYPRSRITAVSNSRSQRLAIESAATQKRLDNVSVITEDMNNYLPQAKYDRIVSVEMFEHMSNWSSLLERLSEALKSDGRLFLHVFSHRDTPYRFDMSDRADWIAQHFFTGGIMPSHGLIRHFPDTFRVEAEWRWSGEHYRRTAEDWLANFDREIDEIDLILKDIYGANADVWRRRWRLFFLATAGLFGEDGGSVWGVSHFRLKHAARPGEA